MILEGNLGRSVTQKGAVFHELDGPVSALPA